MTPVTPVTGSAAFSVVYTGGTTCLLVRLQSRLGQRLRHFVTQQLQHRLRRVPLGHLLARTQALRALAAHAHLLPGATSVFERGGERGKERVQSEWEVAAEISQ